MSTTLAPTAHHPEGPSNFTAWSICACFDGEHDADDLDVAAIAKEVEGDEPEPEEQEEKEVEVSPAARGQAQHKSLAGFITGALDPFAGLADWERKQVEWVAEEVIQHAAAHGYGRNEIVVEQRVSLVGPGFQVEYFGTLDVRYGPFVCDAKFGFQRNYFPQLAGYGLAVMEADDVNRLFLRTIYGRFRRAEQYVLTKETAETVVYGILRRRRSLDRRPVLCEFCGWCKHKLTCAAINGVTSSLVNKREDWPELLPTAHTSRAANDPLTLGAMRFMWKYYIEPWGKSVEYATSTMAEGGVDVLGFDRKPQKGKAKIGDTVDAFKALRAAGMTVEDIIGAAKVTASRLAAAYHARLGGTKANAEREVERLLTESGALTRGDPTFRLMRSKTAEDDIRAAIARPVIESRPNGPTILG